MRAAMVTGLLVGAYWTLVAVASGAQLADAPTRGAIPTDARLSALQALGVVVACIAFFALGRRTDHGRAARAGAVAGFVAALTGGTAQAFAVGPYLDRVLTRYAAPAELAGVVVAAYVAVLTVAIAILAAFVSSRGARRPAPA